MTHGPVAPGPVRAVPPKTRPGSRWRRILVAGLALIVVGSVLGVAAIQTNAFGAHDHFEGLKERIRLFFDPPPDRPIAEEVVVTPPPEESATPAPTVAPSLKPGQTPPPTPSPTPPPVRKKVDVDILKARKVDPTTVFHTEIDKEWCAPAGVQIALAVLGLADASDAFQYTLVDRTKEWEAYRDSHNGGWGPHSMRLALAAYGADGYVVKAYERREDALRESAEAIVRTGAPVILLAWKGAHTWVMTGFRADADPTRFADARIGGAYILDPWYPRVSSIWGPSDGPGVFQDGGEMQRNFLPWKRPEGLYPGRDGNFIVVLPTKSVGNAVPLSSS
jgi:hypothetical protein